VLDFGLWHGPLSLLCAEHGAQAVIGIDLSSKSIDRARQIPAGDLNLRFMLEESTSAFRCRRFGDVIVCFDVMEHVMDYDR